jgi:hypothetical protein
MQVNEDKHGGVGLKQDDKTEKPHKKVIYVITYRRPVVEL